MSGAIEIANSLPARIVALAADIAAEVAELSERCAIMLPGVDSVDAMQAADAVLCRANALAKSIEAERKKIKAPVLALAAEIDAAASDPLHALACIKLDLGNAVLAFQRAENERRAEAERQRHAAEEAARAEAERRRIQAERERQEAERARAQAEAEDVPPWERAPEPQRAAATIEAPVAIEPRSYAEQIAAAPIKAASVTAKTIKRVEITDLNGLMGFLLSQNPQGSAYGVQLLIVNEPELAKLAKVGLKFPGVIVSEIQTIARKA